VSTLQGNTTSSDRARPPAWKSQHEATALWRQRRDRDWHECLLGCAQESSLAASFAGHPEPIHPFQMGDTSVTPAFIL
jgi:hypothetical protein